MSALVTLGAVGLSRRRWLFPLRSTAAAPLLVAPAHCSAAANEAAGEPATLVVTHYAGVAAVCPIGTIVLDASTGRQPLSGVDLATAGDKVVIVTDNKATRVWSADSGLGAPSPTRTVYVAGAPDGMVAQGYMYNGGFDVWSARSDAPARHAKLPEWHTATRLHDLAFAPDGALISLAQLAVYRTWGLWTSNDPTRFAFAGDGEAQCVTVMPRSGLVAVSVVQPTGPRLSDVQSEIQLIELDKSREPADAFARWLARTIKDHTGARVLEPAHGRVVRTLCVADQDSSPGDRPIRALAGSPDGRLLASASSDGARVWDTTTGARLAHFLGFSRALVWLDASRVAVARGQAVVVWDTSTNATATLCRRTDTRVTSVAALPDGRLACGWFDGTVWIVPTEPTIADSPSKGQAGGKAAGGGTGQLA